MPATPRPRPQDALREREMPFIETRQVDRQNRAGVEIDSTTSRKRVTSKRNPFPGETFFMVPTALYETGLARLMRPSQFKRYITLLRVANYNYNEPIPISFSSLERLDSVSKRAARDAHIKLQEFGLILVEKTNPFTYRLIHPNAWENIGPIRPILRKARALQVQAEWRPK